MIIVCRRLLKNTKINAITLYPFILLKNPADRSNAVLINHEKIHIRQQLELLVIFFYIWYLVEYYYWYFKLRDGYAAYRSISFEREAYDMEHVHDYLTGRPMFNFRKFMSKC